MSQVIEKSNKVKKIIILFCTFIVPLLFFLFLASGKVNFNKLPVLTEKVLNVDGDGSFRNKVTVVSFIGENPTLETYQKMLNLYQVVYKSTEKYKKFQVVVVVPENTEGLVKKLKNELLKVGATDLSKWHFVAKKTEAIQKIFLSFETPYKLNEAKAVSEVFIVDEQLRLRGRTDDEDAADGVLFGYDMGSVAVLKNKLREDLKVIFYESKFAVKQ